MDNRLFLEFKARFVFVLILLAIVLSTSAHATLVGSCSGVILDPYANGPYGFCPNSNVYPSWTESSTVSVGSALTYTVCSLPTMVSGTSFWINNVGSSCPTSYVATFPITNFNPSPPYVNGIDTIQTIMIPALFFSIIAGLFFGHKAFSRSSPEFGGVS